MNRRDFMKAMAVTGAATLIPSVVKGTANKTAPLRTVEVYSVRDGKGEWETGSWPGLKKDMIFRLRDPDGTLTDAGGDNEVGIVLKDAERVPHPDGVSENWAVKTERFTIITRDHPLAKRVRVWRNGQQVGGVTRLDMRHGQITYYGKSGEYMYHLVPAATFDCVTILPA